MEGRDTYHVYQAAQYHNKISCKLSAWLVQDLSRKGEKI